MKAQVLANFPYIWVTVVAFIIFLIVYIGVVYFALNKDNKKLFDACSNIPLEDENINLKKQEV